MYLNTWSPAGGTVREGVKRCGLVRGTMSLEADFESLKMSARPGALSCFVTDVQDVSSQPHTPDACCHASLP